MGTHAFAGWLGTYFKGCIYYYKSQESSLIVNNNPYYVILSSFFITFVLLFSAVDVSSSIYLRC